MKEVTKMKKRHCMGDSAALVAPLGLEPRTL